jgi:NAD(P)-dependent dehydrogenase (short-subunit alcohol dehydrogenase family)
MVSMSTILITGANKGLGHEAARRLIAEGHTVWAAARDASAGAQAAEGLGAKFVQLDVTDDASVAAAVQAIRDAGTGLDVLVNNAGISGPATPPRETTADDVAAVYATNVFGVVRVTQAFLPLLEESENPVVVNVASGLGSLAVNNDPSRIENSVVSLGYPTSKTAVVALTDMYARALPDVKVNAVDPGYTATDLNGHSGHQSVTEGTDAIVAMAQVGPDGPTAKFVDREGDVPW